MQDLYGVLGLAPGADQETIKAAFRDLAKRSHPDVNVGDVAAEQRFKEFNCAYEVLSDPDARAAYDRNLRRGHVGGRWRRWPAIATSLTTFLLTVGLAVTAALWIQDASISRSATREPVQVSPIVGMAAGSANPWKPPEAESPRPPAGQSPPEATGAPPTPQEDQTARSNEIEPPRETSTAGEPAPQAGSGGVLPPNPGSPESSALPDPSAERAPAADAGFANWTTYRNARFGFALKYPGEVFAAAETALADSAARAFVSRDGRAMLYITAGPIAAGLTLPKYRRSVMEQRYSGAIYDYTPQQSHWFVLSGTRGDEMFYERVTFSCDGRFLHGWQLTYPLADRASYDRIVEDMHRGYRHSNGPGARCGEGKGEPPAQPRPQAGLPKPQAGLKDVPPQAQFQGGRLRQTLDGAAFP